MTIHDTILLATRNQGKVKELTKMLAPFHLAVVGLDQFPNLADVEETGASFEENALLKASYAAKASGLVAVADDSGLIVEALDGAPGIYSARFSLMDDIPAGFTAPGEESDANAEHSLLSVDERNNKKLLRLMANLPREKRSARFCSAIAAASPTGQSVTTLGFWEGTITSAPRGDNGFGYDPLFLDSDLGQTAAEMSPQEKNRRSHRARAMEALAEVWPGFWASLGLGKA